MGTLTVEEILDTYELSARLKRRLSIIVSERVGKLDHLRVNGLHDEIARLVETYSSPYRERFSVSAEKFMDGHSVDKDQEGVKRERPKVLDYGASAISQMDPFSLPEQDQQRRANPDKLRELLEEHMDPSSLDSALELLFFEDGTLIDDVEAAERITALVYLFNHKGKLIVPDRKVVSFSTVPMSVKFRRRNYPEGSLIFFQKNRERYECLSRTELSRVDSGLYQKLRKERQLGLAIPRVLNTAETYGLAPGQVRRLQILYKKHGSAREVSRLTGHSVATVTKYVREAGLKVRKWGDSPNHLSEDKRDEIKLRIRTTDHTNHRIAKDLKVAAITVKRIRNKLANPAT